MMNTHFIKEEDVVIDLIAQTQGEIYEIAYDMGYDIEDFSEKYLCSDFCHEEMDAEYSVFQLDFGSCSMEYIAEEFKNKGIEIKKRRDEEIFYSPAWIGNMYRRLFFSLGVYSSELSNLVPFSELISISSELEECEEQEAAVILTNKYEDIIANKEK